MAVTKTEEKKNEKEVVLEKKEHCHAGEVASPVEKNKATQVKETVTEKPVKSVAKKTVAKRSAKKTSKPQDAAFVEFDGSQINIQDAIESSRAHYKALYEKEHGVLNSLVVYVKPDEGVAYYVANGVGCDEYKVGI